MVKRLCRITFLALIAVVGLGFHNPAAARVADNCYMEGYTNLYGPGGFAIFLNSFHSTSLETDTSVMCGDFAQIQFRGATTWYYCYVNPTAVDGHMRIAAWWYTGQQLVWPFQPGFYFNCCADYYLNC